MRAEWQRKCTSSMYIHKDGYKIVVEGRVTQDFYTPVNYFSDRTDHESLDIVTKGEQPMSHWVPGVVMHTVKGHTYWSQRGYGNQVWILHVNGIVSRSCHCRRDPIVSTGDHIEAFEIYAYTGATGFRIPLPTIHTHYEEYAPGTINWDYVRLSGQPNKEAVRIDPKKSANQTWEPEEITSEPKKEKKLMYKIFKRKRAVLFNDGGKARLAIIDKSEKRKEAKEPYEVYFLVKKKDMTSVMNFFMHHPDGINVSAKVKKKVNGKFQLNGLTRYDDYARDYDGKSELMKVLDGVDKNNGVSRSVKKSKKWWKHDEFIRNHPNAMKRV